NHQARSVARDGEVFTARGRLDLAEFPGRAHKGGNDCRRRWPVPPPHRHRERHDGAAPRLIRRAGRRCSFDTSLSWCQPALNFALSGVKPHRHDFRGRNTGRSMDKFIKLTGVAAPLPIVNIDTDMIIPKDYLKTIKRTGLAKGLFAEMRF